MRFRPPLHSSHREGQEWSSSRSHTRVPRTQEVIPKPFSVPRGFRPSNCAYMGAIREHVSYEGMGPVG